MHGSEGKRLCYPQVLFATNGEDVGISLEAPLQAGLVRDLNAGHIKLGRAGNPEAIISQLDVRLMETWRRVRVLFLIGWKSPHRLRRHASKPALHRPK